MMIEKVMIQLVVHVNRTGVARGTREELAMLRMQEAKKTNWESRGCEKPTSLSHHFVVCCTPWSTLTP